MAMYEAPKLFFQLDSSHPKVFSVMENSVEQAAKADAAILEASAAEAEAKKIEARYKVSVVQAEINRMSKNEEVKDVSIISSKITAAKAAMTTLSPKTGEAPSAEYTELEKKVKELTSQLIALL